MTDDKHVDKLFEAYDNRCKATDEIKAFLKECPMSYINLIKYAREHNKIEWKKVLRSRGCQWVRKYCIDGYCH